MSSKANNELFQTFIVFFALLLVPLTTHASSAMFVEVELSCGPTANQKSKSYVAKMFGSISGPSIALSRSWRGGKPGFSSMVGYLHKGKLIIKGEGRLENSNDTWKYYFSEKSKGSIKQDLQSGIEGKGGSRKCKLTYIQDVPNQTAFLGEQLGIDNMRLRKQVKDLNSAPADQDKSALIAEIGSLKKQVQEMEGQVSNQETLSSDLTAENKKLEEQVAEVAGLKKQISELEGQISNQEASSENIVQMASVISALKDEVSKKESVIADLNSEVAGLEERVVSSENANQATIDDLKVKLSAKDADLQSLTTALRTLQDAPAPKSSCPEPTNNQEGAGSNDPIIKYLEGKNAELTKQLENCGQGTTKTAQGNNVPQPQSKPKKPVQITDAIFANQWQLSDAVKCGSGSYTIYDRKLGNVFVLNGQKQMSPNSSDVKITQLADNKIRIVTEIFANDMFKQLNNGELFAVFSSTEDVTVLNEGQISVERSVKQLDTNRFMSNPADKSYNTSKEGGKKASCGLLPGVEQNDQVSSAVSSEASSPAIVQKPEPLALPSGKFEAATFCAGVMTFVAGDDFIKSMPDLASNFENVSARHLQAGGVLASRGLEGENMMVAGMQGVMDTVGDTIEEDEVERGSPLHSLIMECSGLDTLG